MEAGQAPETQRNPQSAASDAIASLRHCDLLVVSDAGFPIPRDAHRNDLALDTDLPDLHTVLRLLYTEVISERVVIAAGMEEFNPSLRATFSGAEFDQRLHEEMRTTAARFAEAVVRTGALDPWGNIGLVPELDVPRWFAHAGVRVPDYHRDRPEHG